MAQIRGNKSRSRAKQIRQRECREFTFSIKQREAEFNFPSARSMFNHTLGVGPTATTGLAESGYGSEKDADICAP